MRWSIFDPKNSATLEDVRLKYGVSVDRINELKDALAKYKRQREMLSGSYKLYAATKTLADEVDPANSSSRKHVLHAFNQPSLKAKVKGLMQVGVTMAYVGNVRPKVGATRVYKLETDRSGRIKFIAARPDNPERAASSGLYSVTVVKPTGPAPIKTFGRSPRLLATANNTSLRKRKSWVHFEAELET